MFVTEACMSTQTLRRCMNALPQSYVRTQTDHRRHEDTRQELQIVDINSRIKCYQIKWQQHLQKWSKLDFLNYFQITNPEAEEGQDVQVTAEENSF
jgi:hypothetical protein